MIDLAAPSDLYLDFIRGKIKLAAFDGIDVDLEAINPALKPHTRAIVQWCVKGGNRAVFASFGLHKTSTQIETLRIIGGHTQKPGLITCPLGVRQEFFREAEMRFCDEYSVKLRFIRTDAEVDDERTIYVTNYESIREGKLNPNLFGQSSLDEASVLRSYGSKTYQEFLPLFADVKFKFVATATPSPNRYKELIHYAGYLGIMDTGQALTRFFQRDSTQANNLTLYPHKEEEFWLWVSSWGLFIQRPSDLGFSDEGYDLPALDVRYHEISSDYGMAGSEKDGQGLLFNDAATGLQAAAAEKRDSLSRRIEQLMEIVDAHVRSSSAPCLQQGVLPEEPGTDVGRTEGPRSEKGSHRTGRAGCLSARLPSSESRGIGCETAGSEQSPLCSEQGGIQSKEQGADAQELRADIGSADGDLGTTGLYVPDLRTLPGVSKCAGDRSLPCDGLSPGGSLQEMQHCTGLVGGKPSNAGACAGIPEHVAVAVVPQLVIWCDLNAEQDAIEVALAARGLTFSSIYGALSVDECERRLNDWKQRRTYALIGKPVMLGQGLNLQQANTAVFIGITYKFNDLIQAVHRIQRFGQTRQCLAHVIHTEAEREVLRTLLAKWAQHEEMVAKVTEIIRRYGLNNLSIQDTLARTIGVERIAVSGERFTVANNDAVLEARLQPEDHVDLIVTSIPFANHYEYTPSYNDFGHTENNKHFWKQNDFLTPELFRILKPGRLMCIHVKDRIDFGNVTGKGIPTSSPFHCEAVGHYAGIPALGVKGHGFDYLGMITIVTDVVRENNQTYRLGWSENCKDSTKMGVGSPEYVLLFRKPQSDRTRGYADLPVTKSKAQYTRGRWQVDAHAFWRSSGNRQLTADDLSRMGPDKLAKAFTEYSLQNVYDYEHHVKIGEDLEARGALPSTFMSLAPGSHSEEVWHDVNRMITLNGSQSQRGLQNHVCLARGSLVLTRERGYVAIETVVPGEHALTHLGRWRRVLVARQTGVKPTITVRAQGVPGLTVTPDHKLWARVTDWVRERDGAERAEPQWMEAQHTLGGYINLKLPEIEPASIEDRLHWWIVGRWLADGHWEARGGVAVSCGAHEVERLVTELGAHAGAIRETGTSHQIYILDRSGAIRETLAKCGDGAAGKHLPPEAYSLPNEQAEALLIGYLSGDGHFLESRRRWMASSVSRALALGVALLAQRVFGSIASVYAGRPERIGVIQGREVQCRQDWIISFDAEVESRKRPFVLDDGAWKKVRSIEDVGEKEVWCLRIEEDESFTAEGCIVKNCPLQFDIVDRLIVRYSNPNELVYDPFGGLMTVPYRAVLKGRRGQASELNTDYFFDGVQYCHAAEREFSMPSLFDFETMEAVAA